MRRCPSESCANQWRCDTSVLNIKMYDMMDKALDSVLALHISSPVALKTRPVKFVQLLLLLPPSGCGPRCDCTYHHWKIASDRCAMYIFRNSSDLAVARCYAGFRCFQIVCLANSTHFQVASEAARKQSFTV